MSKFDVMHVMWLIVGIVSGSVLADPGFALGIRADAMLSPSMQLLPFCGEWMTNAFLIVPT